jgi:hypothetical protein
MKVNVHAVNFAVDAKLVGYVQERMDKEILRQGGFFRCLFES